MPQPQSQLNVRSPSPRILPFWIISTGRLRSFSANVAIVSNYVFRGISQTDKGPAIQGGFDYTYNPLSLYVGTWGSNVSSDGYNGASMELDIYAGWRPSFDNLTLDIGALGYLYPGNDGGDINTVEYKAGLSYDFGMVAPGFTVFYSDDWYNGKDMLTGGKLRVDTTKTGMNIHLRSHAGREQHTTIFQHCCRSFITGGFYCQDTRRRNILHINSILSQYLLKFFYCGDFPNLALSSSTIFSSSFLNNGAGVFNFVPGANSLGFHCMAA